MARAEYEPIVPGGGSGRRAPARSHLRPASLRNLSVRRVASSLFFVAVLGVFVTSRLMPDSSAASDTHELDVSLDREWARMSQADVESSIQEAIENGEAPSGFSVDGFSSHAAVPESSVFVAPAEFAAPPSFDGVRQFDEGAMPPSFAQLPLGEMGPSSNEGMNEGTSALAHLQQPYSPYGPLAQLGYAEDNLPVAAADVEAMDIDSVDHIVRGAKAECGVGQNGKAHMSDMSRQTCPFGSSDKVFVYGRCPEKCLPYEKAMKAVPYFRQCMRLAQFGCGMQECVDRVYRCTFMSMFAKTNLMCPGDKIVLDGIHVDSLTDITYKIDLSAGAAMTDMYLLCDGTGSMDDAIGAARDQASKLYNVFRNRGDTAFGVGVFRDEDQLPFGFKNAQSITKNRKAVTSAIASFKAVGGGDRDEGNLQAMYKIATSSDIKWRQGARKILITFGDSPGHEPSCVEGNHITRETVIKALKLAGITVVTISFDKERGGMDAKPDPYASKDKQCLGKAGVGQGTEIAEATGGSLMYEAQQGQLVSAIQKLIGNLKRVFDVDSSSCDPVIKSSHVPELPLTLSPGSSATVFNTMSLKHSICKVQGDYKCHFKYSESGADMATVTVEVRNVKGCQKPKQSQQQKPHKLPKPHPKQGQKPHPHQKPHQQQKPQQQQKPHPKHLAVKHAAQVAQ